MKPPSLYERSDTWEAYENALRKRIIERVERDLQKGDKKKAIDKLESSFKRNPMNQEMHSRVAELYIEIEDLVRAGRHLFLKANPSPSEKKCIQQFEKACGNSPTILLKKYIYKEKFRVKDLDKTAKGKLKRLVNSAVEECGTTPNFLQGIKRHLDKAIKEA